MKHFALMAVVAAAIGFSTGCAGIGSGPDTAHAAGGSIMTSQTWAGMDSTSTVYRFEKKDFDILGAVSAETETKSILGWIASGDGGWKALLDKARSEKGADDVIDVRVDNEYHNIFGIISTVKTRLYGTAVKWK
ncbi:MAG TPA: hypothetical protein VHF22_02355 [Planctomycetota bacterium]|nr:hypothetical protein [Planctomycetota bacterium]